MPILSRKTLVALLLVLLVGLALPVPAHADFDLLGAAASFTGLSATDSVGSAVLKLFANALTGIQGLLVSGITTMGRILSWVINLRPDGGGAVIYTAWKILRDFCNMAFIIVIILTSFGTIFNTFQIGFLKPYSIYNKQLLGGFLMAAIFMNFSLAIGQAVVGVSNQVTEVMIGIMPKDIGGQVAQSLQVAQVIASTHPPLTDLGTPPTTSPEPAGQTADDIKRQKNAGWQTVFLGRYLQCVRAQGSVAAADNCYKSTAKQVAKIPYPEVSTSQQRLYSNAEGVTPKVEVTGGIWRFVGISAGIALSEDVLNAQTSLAQLPTADASKIAQGIPSTIYSLFLLLVLGLSFLVIIIFMLIRIPAIWLLLALSPLAWVSLLFPSSNGSTKWWGQFMAWNIFSPMYLFMIYFGLYMLNQQPALLAQLGRGGAVDAQLGALLFYIMTGIIFVGGSAAVASIAFKGGTVAGNVFGSITGKLGFTKGAGAVGAVYSGVGLKTEIESRTRGLSAGLQAQKERIPFLSEQRQKQRSEELERRYKTRFGTKELVEADLRKKVGEITKKNADEGLSVETMQKKFGKAAKGSAEYLALGRVLLKEGALEQGQIDELMKSAGALGTAGASALQQEVFRKFSEQAKEGELTPANALTALGRITNSLERKKFLGNLKKNQLVEYALLADQGAIANEEKGADGKSLKASEILNQNSSQIEAKDAAKILALATDGKMALGPNVQYRIDDLASKPENVAKMRDAAARIAPTAGATRSASQSVEALVNKAKEVAKQKERTKELLGEQQQAIEEDRAREFARRTTQQP